MPLILQNLPHTMRGIDAAVPVLMLTVKTLISINIDGAGSIAGKEVFSASQNFWIFTFK